MRSGTRPPAPSAAAGLGPASEAGGWRAGAAGSVPPPGARSRAALRSLPCDAIPGPAGPDPRRQSTCPPARPLAAAQPRPTGAGSRGSGRAPRAQSPGGRPWTRPRLCRAPASSAPCTPPPAGSATPSPAPAAPARAAASRPRDAARAARVLPPWPAPRPHRPPFPGAAQASRPLRAPRPGRRRPLRPQWPPRRAPTCLPSARRAAGIPVSLPRPLQLPLVMGAARRLRRRLAPPRALRAAPGPRRRLAEGPWTWGAAGRRASPGPGSGVEFPS